MARYPANPNAKSQHRGTRGNVLGANGCHFRINPLRMHKTYFGQILCHGRARWYGREGEGIGGNPKESDHFKYAGA